MKRNFIFAVFILAVSFGKSTLFAAESISHVPVPYTDEEFAPWLKDLRRAEIITFGAMPFVTLNVTLGFWAMNGFDATLSPFAAADSSSAKYTNDQTLAILLTSFGICAGIGVADFLVHFLKTTNRTSNLKKKGNINIESITRDPDAVKLPPPEPPVPEEN